MNCLQKEPREDSRLEVERLRRTLTADLTLLQSLQSNIKNARLTQTGDIVEIQDEIFEDSDDEVGDDNASGRDGANDPNQGIPPERIPVHLPSSHTTTANQPFRKAELGLRIKQATRYLAALWDAIAQKSFQYSHVMRSAPSKGVRTRSRSAITNITDRITQYSRVYCRARAAIVRLGADERTLDKFKLLTKDDVQASTAILKPNIPGSSSIRLSWIWETGPKISGGAPDAIRECKSWRDFRRFDFDVFPKVQRVHWVRARAQKLRWEEELLLVKYEMEWTTKSFLHKAQEWRDRFEEPNVNQGPRAYAARQSSQWRRMAMDSDRLFRSANSEYISLIT